MRSGTIYFTLSGVVNVCRKRKKKYYRSKTPERLSTSGRSHSLPIFSISSEEVDDRLDVVGLGEHVEGAEGVYVVVGVEEAAEVAREGGGVAGDVGDVRGFEIDDAADGFGFGAGARGVEEDEVGAAEFVGAAFEPVADR